MKGCVLLPFQQGVGGKGQACGRQGRGGTRLFPLLLSLPGCSQWLLRERTVPGAWQGGARPHREDPEDLLQACRGWRAADATRLPTWHLAAPAGQVEDPGLGSVGSLGRSHPGIPCIVPSCTEVGSPNCPALLSAPRGVPGEVTGPALLPAPGGVPREVTVRISR